MKRILIIEDDKELREQLVTLLTRNGYEALAFTDFSNACEQMISANADMVLLDITLPEIDGESLLRSFRKKSETPVIMVTSRNTEMDEMLCMSFGADDFVAKPYNPSILLLRMEAIFKRMGKQNEKTNLSCGKLQLDAGRSVMLVGEKALELTKNEMGILTYLVKHKNEIVSRDALISYLWDSESFVDDNTLTVNVNRVRKKLEECDIADMLVTKRGQGYVLTDET